MDIRFLSCLFSAHVPLPPRGCENRDLVRSFLHVALLFPLLPISAGDRVFADHGSRWDAYLSCSRILKETWRDDIMDRPDILSLR